MSGLVDHQIDRGYAAGEVTEALEYEPGTSRVSARTVSKSVGFPHDYAYDYDDAGQIERATETVDGEVASLWEYGYEPSGALDWREKNGVRTDFSYDEARQLTTAVTGEEVRSFEYDAVGRRTSDSIVGGRSKTYGYDLFGYLSSTVIASGGVVEREDQHVDATGLLARMDATMAGPGQEVNRGELSWDRELAVPVPVGAGDSQGTTTSVPSIDGRVLGFFNQPSGGLFVQDALGNPAMTGTGVDNAVRYDGFGPFGESGERNGPYPGFGFQGQLTSWNELVYLRARQYDPTTGQFLTPDPLPSVVGARRSAIRTRTRTTIRSTAMIRWVCGVRTRTPRASSRWSISSTSVRPSFTWRWMRWGSSRWSATSSM